MARKVGAKNKVGIEVKLQILATYHRLGGLEAFAKWAEANQTEFYRFYSRLAPTEVIAEVTHREVTELSDEQLANIATGSGSGIADSPEGEAETTPLH